MTNHSQPKGTPLAAGSAHVSGTRALSITVERELESPVGGCAVEIETQAIADVASGSEFTETVCACSEAAISDVAESAADLQKTEIVKDTVTFIEADDCQGAIISPETAAATEIETDSVATASAPAEPTQVAVSVTRTTPATEVLEAEETYGDTLELMHKASQSFKMVFDEAGSGVTKLSFSMIKFVQENARNHLDFARDCIATRSLPEIFEVQKSYVKRQFDLLTTQVETLRSLTAELTTKTSAPFKVLVRHHPETP